MGGWQNIPARPKGWCGQSGLCDERTEDQMVVLRDDGEQRLLDTSAIVSSAFNQKE